MWTSILTCLQHLVFKLTIPSLDLTGGTTTVLDLPSRMTTSGMNDVAIATVSGKVI